MSVSPALVAELRCRLPAAHLVTPSSPDYKEAIRRSSYLSILPAGVVAYPTNVSEVAVLVSFASKHSLDLATRCGGHGPRGISSTSGGLCIDLAKLKSMSIDIDTRQATIGGGAIWSEVYAFLQPYDLAAVDSVCSSVGVGGFSLVGGHGWLTGAHGMALDSILKVEVVLADTTVVRASETQNTDLFWAI
jgi:FAD/FMN-containing dehydrogenase